MGFPGPRKTLVADASASDPMAVRRKQPGCETVYSFSKDAETSVPAPPEGVFAVLDDPLRLGRHMAKPSAMMLGGSMRYGLGPDQGRAVGSVIRMDGSVLGVSLSIVERVVERVPPRRKVWETVEEPRLLLFGRYRLGFDVLPEGAGSRVRAFIDYDLPQAALGRALGSFGAHAYARWCLERIMIEARAASRQSGTRGGVQG